MHWTLWLIGFGLPEMKRKEEHLIIYFSNVIKRNEFCLFFFSCIFMKLLKCDIDKRWPAHSIENKWKKRERKWRVYKWYVSQVMRSHSWLRNNIDFNSFFRFLSTFIVFVNHMINLNACPLLLSFHRPILMKLTQHYNNNNNKMAEYCSCL